MSVHRLNDCRPRTNDMTIEALRELNAGHQKLIDFLVAAIVANNFTIRELQNDD